ncbi:MAG TPA: alpha/beta hydrolase [Streptomyces sp.]|uniref:alpha/beta hydrolase n=1 Tax=Streptomyces sp. TaxID=1931 RepID=UPI002B50CD74|nr:alpha/beta hydrolase [Streptomyces sp.]HWU06168.1 alpha/beta hydrolase [Streptomyces sp.]
MTTTPFSPARLHADAGEPLVLARQGFFWTGIEPITSEGGPAVRGQMYVEYWIPQDLRHRLPVVMIHGGGGQGLDYLGDLAGGEGWVHRFVRQGYAVYVVDRPGHGRSPADPVLQGPLGPSLPSPMVERLFSAPSQFPERHQGAEQHTQWVGGGRYGDAVFDAFLAGMGPMHADAAQHYSDCLRGGVELLDLVGEAILVTHSAGGPVGWLLADARPELVAGIVAVEPLGPSFQAAPPGALTWGLTALPLTFEPPATTPEELGLSVTTLPSGVSAVLQTEPARKLPKLAGVPVAVVTAEASWATGTDPGTVAFLQQAGVAAEHIRLGDHGVHGNGHMMMSERNSGEVAGVIESWLSSQGLTD